MDRWIGLLAALVLLPTGRAIATTPNIVLIIADDLSWTDLGTGRTNGNTGSALHETPAVHSLAQQGLAFTSAYAQQACSPTRASILTGQFAIRHGIYAVASLDRPNEPGTTPIIPPDIQFTDRLRVAPVTLAEGLNTRLVCAHFGKFHITRSAEDIIEAHGFAYNFGGTNDDGIPGSYFAEFANGDWRFNDPRIGPELDPYAAPYDDAYIERNIQPFSGTSGPPALAGTPKHLSDAMADAVEQFIAERTVAGEPFFAHIGFHAVHTTIESRPDLEAKYAAILSDGPSPDPRHTRAAYAGLIEGLDQSIARILRAIDDPNGDGDTDDSIAGNTIVIFLSDNGGADSMTNNAPLRGQKGGFYEGGIRIPMILRVPDPASPGAFLRGGDVTDHAVHVADLYPTMLELANIPPPDTERHDIEGESLVPLLHEEPTSRGRPIYYHFPGYLFGYVMPISVVIESSNTTGRRYKLSFEYEPGAYTLYDLDEDPGETKDLLADPGSILASDWAAAVQLSASLRGWLDQQGAVYGTWRATGFALQPPPVLPPDAPSGVCGIADIASPLGVLNIDDVIAYLDAFALGDPAADLAPPARSFNIDDLLMFVDAFFFGCS